MYPLIFWALNTTFVRVSPALKRTEKLSLQAWLDYTFA
jgi:hypothetical protein